MTAPPPGAMGSEAPTGEAPPRPPDPPRREAAGEYWHRLHPLSPLVRMGRSLPGLAIVLAIPFFTTPAGQRSGDLTDLGVIALVGVGALIAWWVTRWHVEDGVLVVETGLIRQRHTQLPINRIQSVDVIRPGTARLFGLAELRVRSGGSHDGDARLAYLSSERAEEVRSYLLALVHGATVGRVDTRETPLTRSRNRRLLVAVPLQGPVLLLLGLVVGLFIAVHFVPGQPRDGLIGLAVVLAAALATAVGRQYNSQLNYEVAETGDGLVVRGGAIGTVVETVPRRRIQALRISEPLLWRPFGWARLLVDVAGGQRRHDEDRAAAGRVRVLVPVGDRAEVADLLAHLLGIDGLAVGSPPPPRARIKALLSYHLLRARLADGYAVAQGGRVRRLTTVVPLAKVQSVRWVQGPLQRRLSLATVHVDVVGRGSTGLALRDRSVGEAQRLAQRLPDLCRLARAQLHPAAVPLPPGSQGSDVLGAPAVQG